MNLTRLSTGTPYSDDPQTREAQEAQDLGDYEDALASQHAARCPACGVRDPHGAHDQGGDFCRTMQDERAMKTEW